MNETMPMPCSNKNFVLHCFRNNPFFSICCIHGKIQIWFIFCLDSKNHSNIEKKNRLANWNYIQCLCCAHYLKKKWNTHTVLELLPFDLRFELFSKSANQKGKVVLVSSENEYCFTVFSAFFLSNMNFVIWNGFIRGYFPI